MLIIKPYFDSDVDLSLELMDILPYLNNDTDRDVLVYEAHDARREVGSSSSWATFRTLHF